jgi:hypothetical protein
MDLRNPRLGLVWPLLAFVTLAIACGGGEDPPQAAAPDTPPTVEAGPTPVVEPTPVIVRRDILATRLIIPSLNIDSNVQLSRRIPYVDNPPAGCPGNPDATETLTVPNNGIATPEDNLEGMENKSWIIGHSRWLGTPGTLFTIQDLNKGDELFIEGTDRATGQRVERQRYVVDNIYLTDTKSGEPLVNAAGPQDIPRKPIVMLQTSVREDGPGKQWILNEQKLRAKATTLIEGDVNDPCKYLLLFVIATAA